MRTITLKNQLSFTKALQSLLDGKCIGIQPKSNTNFIVKYTPIGFKEGLNYRLCWHRSVKEGQGNESIPCDFF